MKNLRVNNIDTEAQYSLAKEGSKGFVKGATSGLGVAGAINTAFPALIPTFAGIITGASDMSTIAKIGVGLGLASNPAVQISGLTILGIGAAVGALVGGTVSLIKTARYKRIAKKEKQLTR